MIREGYEIYKRHKFDAMMNDEDIIIYSNNKWRTDKSINKRIGEIILMKDNDTCTADVIIIDSSNKEEVCFVETRNLDGEKEKIFLC